MQEEKENKIPIIEIYGPVIQGEGALIGKWTTFVRTGGCDYKCKLCDSLYAVIPEQVKKNATWMTQSEIADKIINSRDSFNSPWITFSGGNPALWDVTEAIDELKYQGFKISVETQGSLWKPWILLCDQITISPKFNGMGNYTELSLLHDFLGRIFCRMDPMTLYSKCCLKVPVFNDDDLDNVEKLVSKYGKRVPIYLSLGNDCPPGSEEHYIGRYHSLPTYLLAKYGEMAEKIKQRPSLMHTIFLPQLHVLAYENERMK